MDKQKKPINLELDDLDLRIAKELEPDARQTNRLLAQKLAISEGTVKRRLQKLLDGGFIKIAAISNRILLGMPIGLSIGLNVSPGMIDSVVAQLLPHKNIQIIQLITGRYDIIIGTVFSNIDEQNKFLTEGLNRTPHLTSFETMMMVQGIKISWRYLNNETPPFREPKPHDLDELDLKLIKELELSPRENIIKLAEKIKVNRNVAGRRLRSLMDDGVIQVVSIPEPSISDLNIRVYIFAKVFPDKVKVVADSFVADKNVHRIYIIAGRFNLLMNASFRDINELSNFVGNRLGNCSGFVSHETMIQLTTFKSSFSLMS